MAKTMAQCVAADERASERPEQRVRRYSQAATRAADWPARHSHPSVGWWRATAFGIRYFRTQLKPFVQRV